MNFDIKTEQLADDAYVISLAGEVDLYTAPEFKQQLLEVIGQGAKHVIVDFTNTTFIDSTTLGVLVGGVKRLRTNDGQLSLVCSDRNITKIFEITGLDRVFAIYGTRDEAVAKLDGAAQPPRSDACASALRTVAVAAAPRRSPRAAARSGASRAATRRQRQGSSSSSKCGALPHARRRQDERARSGRTSTTPSVRQEAGLRRADDPRRRARPDRLPRGADAGESLRRAGRRRRRGLRREVRRQPELRRHRRVERPARDHDDLGRRRRRRAGSRRQGGLREGGLRQLPHAEGGRLDAATSARTSTS